MSRNKNKTTTKVTPVSQFFVSLGMQEIYLGTSELLHRASKLVTDTEDDNDYVDNVILHNIDELNDNPVVITYHHNKHDQKSSLVDKVEIVTRAKDDLSATIKALRLAEKYIRKNRKKYEFTGNIVIRADSDKHSSIVKACLYMYKYDKQKD